MRRLGRRSTLFLALGAAGLVVGCSDTPPVVATRWATEARADVSPDTPQDEVRAAPAERGPPDEREVCDLEDLHLDEDLGDVVVELEAGLYTLESAVLLKGATSVVIRGAGPHLTRLELDTESSGSILIPGTQRLGLRDLTIAAYTGGGIRVRDCPDVRVENVHFAGARHGVDIERSTARVERAVFAGCQEGLSIADGALTVRESVFVDGWIGIKATDAALDLEACAFVRNRDAIDGALDDRARIHSVLFAGPRQDLAWDGMPGEVSSCLVPSRDLDRRVGVDTNREIVHVEEFPDGLVRGLPPKFRTADVHLALERARRRGEEDPPGRVKTFARGRALEEARRAARELKAGRVDAAEAAAALALGYLGDTPLAEAPREVVEIADLAR